MCPGSTLCACVYALLRAHGVQVMLGSSEGEVLQGELLHVGGHLDPVVVRTAAELGQGRQMRQEDRWAGK